MSRHHRVHIAGALSIYTVFSFAVFGLRPLLHPGSDYVGVGEDPQIFIWAFAWWPHAILHGLNPFVTHAIWSPDGVNLTWTTSVPGLALLFSPLTLAIGAAGSYNVAAVLMPALAAWTAFLLCRRLTGAFWPSLFGGYLFGFSGYLIGHEEGHMHATSVFLVPVIALIAVRFLEGDLTRRGLIVRLAPAFAAQMLFSTEVTFTLAIALVCAFCVGFCMLSTRRQRLAEMVPAVAASVGIGALAISPFLVYAISGMTGESFNRPQDYSTDVLNYVVPTHLMLLGGGWTHTLVNQFPGNNSERGGYLGIPLLILLGLYARGTWRRPSTKALLIAFSVSVVGALGVALTFKGSELFPLPMRLVADRPFFNNVLPGRLAMYTALVVAIAGALWMHTRRPGFLRIALPVLVVCSMAPNPWSGAFVESYRLPAFFTDSIYRSCIQPGDRVLPLPIGSNGIPMLWQVAEDFRFDMAGGRILPSPPASFLNPGEIALISAGYPVEAQDASQFVAFIEAKHVTHVVVDEAVASKWTAALDRLATPHRFGGVVLYTFAPGGATCLGGTSTGGG